MFYWTLVGSVLDPVPLESASSLWILPTIPEHGAGPLCVWSADRRDGLSLVVIGCPRGSIRPSDRAKRTSIVCGLGSAWFDMTLSPVASESCTTTGWITPQSSCLQFARTSPCSRYQASDVTGRLHHLADVGLAVTATLWPGHTYDEVVAEFRPLFDNLRISPTH